MRTDLTDVTLVIDRSGSMQSIRSDAEGGINSFIEVQKAEPGEALLTLVQFNTEYEFVQKGVSIGSVPEFKLLPCGATALLDAVGRAINETEARMSAMEEAMRPGLVMFVVVTDGQENSSHEFNREQIRKMIEHKQSVHNWQFTFLAANQDAFAEAASLGIAEAGAANFCASKVGGAYSAMAKKTSRMRKAMNDGGLVDNQFSIDELREMT